MLGVSAAQEWVERVRRENARLRAAPRELRYNSRFFAGLRPSRSEDLPIEGTPEFIGPKTKTLSLEEAHLFVRDCLACVALDSIDASPDPDFETERMLRLLNLGGN